MPKWNASRATTDRPSSPKRISGGRSVTFLLPGNLINLDHLRWRLQLSTRSADLRQLRQLHERIPAYRLILHEGVELLGTSGHGRNAEARELRLHLGRVER